MSESLFLKVRPKRKMLLPALPLIKNKCLQTKIYFPRKCQTLVFCKRPVNKRETRLARIFAVFEINSRLVLFRVGGVSMAPETKMAEMFKIFWNKETWLVCSRLTRLNSIFKESLLCPAWSDGSRGGSSCRGGTSVEAPRPGVWTLCGPKC